MPNSFRGIKVSVGYEHEVKLLVNCSLYVHVGRRKWDQNYYLLQIFIHSILRRRFVNPDSACAPEKLSDGMTIMHKGKANGICYKLQMARVMGHHVHKRSHFGRH